MSSSTALVYGTLTTALGLVFFGGVTMLQVIFRTLIGEESDLAIIASTLAIAALFEPLRRRIHAFIDRCFYRRKYDTRKTLEAFSAQLRDETDLDALRGDLVVVHRLHPPEGGRTHARRREFTRWRTGESRRRTGVTTLDSG